MNQNRAAAFRRLRTIFAEVYNELRRRGHEVIVDYEDAANPYYIPKILAIDDLPEHQVKIDFSVNVMSVVVSNADFNKWYVEVRYEPSNAARVRGGARREGRSERETPRHMTGPKLADWVERVLQTEKRMASWYVQLT